jgi:hypothetical protein
MNVNRGIATTFATLVVVIGGYVAYRMVTSRSPGSHNIWEDVLSKCADGAQTKNVKYFSVSNNLGPGTIWKPSKENGFIPVRLIDSAAARESGAINRGTPSSCQGGFVSTGEVSTDIGVKTLFSVLPVGDTATFAQARRVSVGIDRWAWDDLMEGPFRDMLSTLVERDSADPYVADVLRPDYRVIGRAVRAEGITTSLDFTDAVANQLRAKYPGGLDADGRIKTSWKDSTSLELKLTQPAYVAVQLYRWSTTGLQGKQLLPDTTIPDTTARRR